MEKRTKKEWAIRMGVLCIGLVIAHFGVTLFMLVQLGADPFNVLIQGIASYLPITHGMTHMISCLLIIGVLVVVDKQYIKMGTLVCMLLGGPIIDFFTYVLKGVVHGGLPLWGRVGIVAIGCVILAFGMTLVIQSDAGTGPNDLVAVVISEKLHKSFGIVRVVTDVLFVLGGVVLGGVFGIGTVVCAFLVGSAAAKLMPISEKIVKCCVERGGVSLAQEMDIEQ